MTLITCQYFETGVLLTSLDLKDTYFYGPICPSNQHYLRFAYDGKVFQFKVLSFDLSSAPNVFTMMLAPVIALIHRRSIGFHFDLDDCLVMVFNLTILRQSVQTAISILAKPGFTVNWKESSPEPCQCLKFLGMNIDSLHSKVFFPEDRALKSRSLCQPVCCTMISSGQAVHEVSEFNRLGSALLVVPTARVMMRPI